MAAIWRAPSKWRRFLETYGFRKFSSDSSLPETCSIMGFYGEIRFPGHRFQSWDDYLSENPLLTPIRDGRLIKLQPNRSLRSTDASRYLLRSGAIQCHFCKKHGISLAGRFREDNVGVIKDMGIISFKELLAEREDLTSDKGYNAYSDFLIQQFHKRHEVPLVSELPYEIAYAVEAMAATGVDEDWVLDLPSFFSDEQVSTLEIDIHRMLRQEFWARDLGTEAEAILQSINMEIPDAEAVARCSSNFLLKHLMGMHDPTRGKKMQKQSPGSPGAPPLYNQQIHQSQIKPFYFQQINQSQNNPYQNQAKQNKPLYSQQINQSQNKPYQNQAKQNKPLYSQQINQSQIPQQLNQSQMKPYWNQAQQTRPPGCVVVDVHRIALSHAVEKGLISRVITFLPTVDKDMLDLLDTYDREEVQHLLSYTFPPYPITALEAFKAAKLLGKLQLRRRNPFPSIFHAAPFFWPIWGGVSGIYV